VVVRANGLLGARYVELDPGHSGRMLPNGGMIVETNPTSTYTLGVSDALNLFDTPTRTALGEMINGLGQGVEGRGAQLNEAIQLGPKSGQDFDTAADAILARPGAAAAFLPAVDSAMSAFDSVRNQLADVLHPAAVSAAAFVSRGGAVDQALSLAPSWERGVVSFGAPASQLLSAAGRLASASDAVLPSVPQALRSTASLLTQGGAPLRATKPVFNEVPRVTPAALSILSSLRPDLAPLQQAFTKLVQPVSTLAIHGCDLQNWATAVRSLVNFGTVPGGHWGPDVGFPLSVVASPQEAHTVASTGIPFPTENDYPAPCAYSPGATISGSTLLDVLSGALP
jgi:ABC-type transporter Mla subunit MlaD